MMCFRDRTFCSAPCSNTECSRNYNPTVRRQAMDWWASASNPSGEGVPIALGDFSMGCEEYIKKDESDDN